MVVWRWLVLSAIFGLMSAWSAADPAKADEILIKLSPPWRIYAWFDEHNKFGHCGMQTGSKVGNEEFRLLVGPYGYSVFLTDTGWNLPSGQKYRAIVDIDGHRWNGEAEVYHQHGVAMRFGFETGFGQQFEFGTLMTLHVGELARSLTLIGSRRALGYMSQCLGRYLPSKNPFEGNSRPVRPVGNPFE